MSFTDQKQRIATKQDVNAHWSGGCNGKNFRCYLCGHKFIIGDKWRWVYAGNAGLMNFMTCAECDSEDVMDKWIEANKIVAMKYWWFRSR